MNTRLEDARLAIELAGQELASAEFSLDDDDATPADLRDALRALKTAARKIRIAEGIILKKQKAGR